MAGMPTTCGDPLKARDPLLSSNSLMVQRVLDAGAVIWGKTNLPIHANDLQSYNDIYGVSSNPWDTGRTPGGSSGGSASAVATYCTSLEMGGDVGGSIRGPAAFCGVYGHKPTYGIVPIVTPTYGLQPNEVVVHGPFARTPEDLGKQPEP